VNYGGYTNLHGPARIDIPDTEDELPPELLSAYGLAQNFPNPFNPTTKIAFKLTEPNAENAKLIIYNPKGQIVKVFTDLQTNGNELGSVIWKGDDEHGNAVSSGIYLYKLKTSYNEYSKKMIMIK
jgi:flagellar hook assembly protein FlgD